jgi:hypothetical protein
MPIGIALMLFAAFCRLLRFGAWKTVVQAIADHRGARHPVLAARRRR